MVRYVLTANTSHSSGDLKFVHRRRWFGYGRSQKKNQPRPRWISGYMPAHMTAITVIASAARLKLERYLERNRNNTAEISVPECAIPTQKTKLMMSNAQ